MAFKSKIYILLYYALIIINFLFTDLHVFIMKEYNILKIILNL